MFAALLARFKVPKAHAYRRLAAKSHNLLYGEAEGQESPAIDACTPGIDCEDCPNQDVTGSTLPLCLVEPGARVRIVRVDEGRRFRRRLAELGVVIGTEAHVLRASYHTGPMILVVCNDSRLAVGWGMAKKIYVQVQR